MRKRHWVRVAAFAFLALVAELAGRSVTGRVDRTFHVAPLARSDTSYYPFLLAGVKVVAAFALAALAARAARTRASAEAGRRVLGVMDATVKRPRLRLSLSVRVWALLFAATSLVYLAHTNAERIASRHAPVLAPWLHTYALPVFAVLAVVGALAWCVVDGWLVEYERYAVELVECASRVLGRVRARVAAYGKPLDDLAPRRRFGLAFECRPPPHSV